MSQVGAVQLVSGLVGGGSGGTAAGAGKRKHSLSCSLVHSTKVRRTDVTALIKTGWKAGKV